MGRGGRRQAGALSRRVLAVPGRGLRARPGRDEAVRPSACLLFRDRGERRVLRWKDVEGASRAPWSAELRERVRGLVNTAPPTLSRPKVFVYPLPAAFLNLSWTLVNEYNYAPEDLDYVAGTTRHARLSRGGRGGSAAAASRYSFLELALGAHNAAVAGERWRRDARGHVVWAPGGALVDQIQDPRRVEGVVVQAERGLSTIASGRLAGDGDVDEVRRRGDTDEEGELQQQGGGHRERGRTKLSTNQQPEGLAAH